MFTTTSHAVFVETDDEVTIILPNGLTVKYTKDATTISSNGNSPMVRLSLDENNRTMIGSVVRGGCIWTAEDPSDLTPNDQNNYTIGANRSGHWYFSVSAQ